MRPVSGRLAAAVLREELLQPDFYLEEILQITEALRGRRDCPWASRLRFVGRCVQHRDAWNTPLGKQFLIPKLKNLEEEPSKSNLQAENTRKYAIVATVVA